MLTTLKLDKPSDLHRAIASGKEVVISAPYYHDRGYTHTLLIGTRAVYVYDQKGKALTEAEMWFMMDNYVSWRTEPTSLIDLS